MEEIGKLKRWVDFWWRCNHFVYEWRKDDGDEYLVAWINFDALKSFVKLFNSSNIDEFETDFTCILRNDCVVFPHFEETVGHIGLNETEIKEIFE